MKHSTLNDLVAENRHTAAHAVFWEVVAVVMMISAVVAAVSGWKNPTALAGVSIAAATLALYRSGK